MNIRELTYVALKITGILSFLWGLRMWDVTISVVTFLDRDMPYAQWLFLAALIPFIVSMLIAYLLLGQTKRAIEWMHLPDARDTPDEMRLEELLHAAFAVIAVALLTIGLSELINVVGLTSAYLNTTDPLTGHREALYLSSAIHGIVEILVKIALGLYLFFGGVGLIRFWKKYREKRLLID